MDQFITYADQDSREAGNWGCCDEDTKMLTAMEFFQTTPKLLASPSVSNDEPVFFHAKSKLIFTGHNIEFAFFPPGHAIPPEMAFEGGLARGFLGKVPTSCTLSNRRSRSSLRNSESSRCFPWEVPATMRLA